VENLRDNHPESKQTGAHREGATHAKSDAWEGCLVATGGALSPKKPFWYLVDYKWSGPKWEYRTKAEMPANLTMKDSEGVTHILCRHEADHAEKTLGVHTAPDGWMEGWFENKDGTRTITGEFSYWESVRLQI